MRSFAKSIFPSSIMLDDTDKGQSTLLNHFIDFNKRTKIGDI